MEISLTKTSNFRKKIPDQNLGFGRVFSDHMFLMDYAEGSWKNPRIQPYGPLTIDPAASVLHYGQGMFEGMKAFCGKDGKIRFFRPQFHAERMAVGAARICMPAVHTEDFLEAIEALVRIDIDWVPKSRGSSLYLRPTLIGTEPFLGVRPADKYLFFVLADPVSAYYAEGFNPVRIWIEEEFIRAAPGGLGAIKAGANYASSLLAAVNARKQGCSQVLWLDAVEKKYIEEVGTMNVFFRFNDEVVTPPLHGTILNGATRDSVLHILKDWKVNVQERPLTLQEVRDRHAKGELLEVFGTGTAAVISAVCELVSPNKSIKIGSGKVGELTQKLYDHITAIQYGEVPDSYNWTKILPT